MASAAYGQEADLASAIPERQQRVGSTCSPDRKAAIQGHGRLKGSLLSDCCPIANNRPTSGLADELPVMTKRPSVNSSVPADLS